MACLDRAYTGKPWFQTVQENGGLAHAVTDLSAAYGVADFGLGTGDYSKTKPTKSTWKK
jgi:hypothetical protein